MTLDPGSFADPGFFANRVVDECASTNDLARSLAERGFPHGTWVSARRQAEGRGRHGRRWEGIEGNLFLSIVARISDPRLWSWVPLAAAVGAAAGLREYDRPLDIRIKWPNDLWLGGAKLGGVLCEAVGAHGGAFIVIGIGLNCVESPKGLCQEATSLSEAIGTRISADEVRRVVLGNILSVVGDLQSLGPEPIRLRYEKWAALAPGSRIEWGSSPARSGRVKGLGSAGELIVLDERGRVERLFAEDVRAGPKASGGSPA